MSLLSSHVDVADPLAAPTPAQLEVAEHPTGPLIVSGGAGTGKTRALVARFAHLVAAGIAPEAILVLSASPAAAASLRAQVENALGERAYEELHVHELSAFAWNLVAGEALEAGVDPFAHPVAPADRVAMLLDRIDELTVRHHDFRGDVAALVASFVRRIDALKEEGITQAEYAEWAAVLPEDDDVGRARAARERELAAVYAAHDRMLAAAGALDGGDVLLRAVGVLRDSPQVRARVAGRFCHLLVDDVQDLGSTAGVLVRLLASERGEIVVAGDPDQAIRRFRGTADKNLDDLRAALPRVTEIGLTPSLRCPETVLRAAAAVLRSDSEPAGTPGGEVAFWRCANERAQAQAVAADVERLVAREGVAPEDIAILVRSLDSEGQAVSVALEERAVPHRLVGGAAFLRRAEVRDLLAWLRLLADPGDAGAVVRALARPPVALSSADLARCTQIARRRKLDLVAGLAAALESPQLPPEARDRVQEFLRLHRSLAAVLDTARPDLFVFRLIERLGLRRQLVFSARPDVVEQLQDVGRLAELASAYVRRAPRSTAREFAAYVAAVADAGLREEDVPGEPAPARAAGVRVLALRAAKAGEWDHVYVLGIHAARMPGARREEDFEPVPEELLREAVTGGTDLRDAHLVSMRRVLFVAMTRARRRVVLAWPSASPRGTAQPPSPFAEEARAALGVEWEDRAEELFGPTESLHAAYRALRDELLGSIARTGSRLGEMRFDTDLDISHAVVRFLEVVKLAALIERSSTQAVAEALPQINARLLGAVTSEQREILLSSSLDDLLVGEEADALRRAAATVARAEPSLEPFLPRRGDGLVLSASDIDAYLTCPLKYKFARVFRIPAEPTIHQRFGIVVHQALERFHVGQGHNLAELLGLLDTAWRRSGFGDSEEERQLYQKARDSLTRYAERFASEQEGEPVWFERSFSFRMGPHLLRGRVDRIDRLHDGGYELIDYKTGRPKSAAELRDDVQLSLYAVGAREAWSLDGAQGSYYYVLDDTRVRVPPSDGGWIADTVMEVAEGIGSQGFEPTPSFSVCSRCDFRIACPAAER